MRSPIPSHAERISIGGETAYLWQTEIGWRVMQGPYEVDVENVVRDGQPHHIVDWFNRAPRNATFAGGLARHEEGHMDRVQFLEVAERLVALLRKGDSCAKSRSVTQ